ncbi:hypothetical protein L1049_020559 [Liquidambar formosana]|uniref:Trafficking protein particle complex subunit 2 n=1 Tax=Liquidambar formosana TaxID=63359 RepID=A0AAP0XAU1_LIQFO
MATTACFIIVSRNDIPIYEAEVGSAVKREDAAQQHQFILHAALDIVQDLAWTTSAMFLKAIDRFNDLVVSVYVTAVSLTDPYYIHTRLMLLHDSRNDDGIKSFFQEVHELYIKFDNWLPCGPIIQRWSFRGIHDAALPYNATVSLIIDGLRWKWPVTVRNPRRPGLLEIHEELSSSLPVPSREDVAIWKLSSNGCFSIASAWDFIRGRSNVVFWRKLIWFPKAIRKHACIHCMAYGSE